MKRLLTLFSALLALVSATAPAQMGQMALLNSPVYEAAAAPLRSAPPRQYNFSRAVLSDVMRLMAEDAGIGFFGLPEGMGSGDNLVTFTLNASPFAALETLAKANGVSLIYDSGIWYLRPANDQELIGRIYEINYNAQELVTKNTQSGIGGSGGSNGNGNGNGNSSSGAAGLNLQGSPDFFVTEPSRILEDIQNILNIPTTGGNATFAPTASVDNVAQLSLGGFQGQPDLVVRQAPAGTPESGSSGQSKVIWNSDSNTLYVVATRQQHQWIEAYLASADRPQPMIAVEVKFIETSRDPSSDLGIDWNGVLGQNGLQINLNDATGPIDLNSVGNYSLPTAVLSYSDLNLKLRALYSDRKTRMVSYPRMVTLDNREVSFRSVINQPVLGTSASASLGAGATETSSIEYLPIGTVINVLPKRMAGNKILLNVSVTVSDIIGTEFINGNPFPIATSRVYTAPLTVQSGFTVAISGLDAARSDENESGVPILGRLPVIGYAFKNRKQDRSRQHLMMLITPVALNSGTEGLTEKPITREPWKAAPAVHQPVAYPSTYESKAPVYETSYRQPVVQAQPIADIPEFHEPASTPDRKSSRTFGREDEAEVAPMAARTVEVAPAAAVGYPPVTAPAADPLSPAKLNASTLAPIPSALNTPAVLTTMDTAPPVTAPEPPRNPVPAKSEAPAPVPAAAPAPAQPQAPSPGAYPAAVPSPAPATPVGKSADAGEKPIAAVKESDPRIADIRGSIAKLEAELKRIPEGDSRLSPDDGQLVLNVHDEAGKLLTKVEEVRGDKSKPLAGELGDTWWDLINLKSQAAKLSRRSPESLAVQSGAEAEKSEAKSEAGAEP